MNKYCVIIKGNLEGDKFFKDDFLIMSENQYNKIKGFLEEHYIKWYNNKEEAILMVSLMYSCYNDDYIEIEEVVAL